MGKKIHIDEGSVEYAYAQLLSASTQLNAVKHDLPGKASSSKAMNKFMGESKASKRLFGKYRTLFSNDIASYKSACETYGVFDEKVAKDISKQLESSAESSNSSGGTSGGGYGGGGGGAR